MASEARDQTAEVLRLSFVEGLSVRAIARRLSMARRTVRRLLGRGLPTPREPAPPTRPSMLDRFAPQLRGWLEQTPELSAPAALERLRPLGYSGGVSILRERMSALRPRAPREAFLTLDFQPGEAAQVDWADFGFAVPGCPRRVSAFVMALCYSRYLYIEFVLSQSMGSFLRCMERGLAFFGGTTLVDIYDNMKTVVLEPHPQHPVFNPRFVANRIRPQPLLARPSMHRPARPQCPGIDLARRPLQSSHSRGHRQGAGAGLRKRGEAATHTALSLVDRDRRPAPGRRHQILPRYLR